MIGRDLTRIHPEVTETLARGGAVVALESAVITHGLPRQLNVRIAREMEAVVRSEGATPATIAVLDGAICVGLSDDDLDRLADAPDARKCGTRDLALAVAAGRSKGGSGDAIGDAIGSGAGGTTVSATARIAWAVGIRVFATGGIGGVHRGSGFDVSADLVELGRTPITVVCSGAKSLLDLPATVEVLETQGVAVLGYRTDRFPAFYVAASHLPVTARIEEPSDVASVVAARDALGLPGAILVTVPVPAGQALAWDEIERIVQQATADAAAEGATGPAVTPRVLARMAEISDGRTLSANRALLVNNARVAARIAVALGRTV
jgi:pseudouridine-5'-phosphate glycosidase